MQTAVSATADGDRAVVPAGTCIWTSVITISNKTIILEGAGSGAGGTKIVHEGGNHTLISVSAGTKKGKMEIFRFWFSGGSSNWWNDVQQIAGRGVLVALH